jgi:amidase
MADVDGRLDQLTTASATTQLAAMRSGRASSRELLESFLDRIERLGGPINAVVTLDSDRARTAADRADRARSDGVDLGPLHGLPVTVKDAIEVGGVRSTGGAVELSDHVPDRDAPAVARLRGAGAVVFGKTNAPAWSGDIQTSNALFGTTANPWDPARTAGGSSGGSAAAVACGFSALELGTDIGGSIRIPAHFCGVYGLKPSWGVISQQGYLDHIGGGRIDVDLNVFGPIARAAEDLGLALSVLAGPGPDQAAAWSLQLPPPRRSDPREYRIGYWFDEPAAPVSPDVGAVLDRAVGRLSAAGWQLERAHPPVEFSDQVRLFGQLITSAVSPGMPAAHGDRLGGSHRAWLGAQEQRTVLRRVWSTWFERFDALLCPVMGVTAFPHDLDRPFRQRSVPIAGTDVAHADLIAWLGLIGVLGLPSVVVPAGTTSAGRPAGVQIVTPWYREREGVQLAAAAGPPIGGYRSPPGFGTTLH